MWTVTLSRSANAGKRGRAEYFQLRSSPRSANRSESTAETGCAGTVKLWSQKRCLHGSWGLQATRTPLQVGQRKVGLSECEKAVNEISQRTRILRHKGVTTSGELSEPRLGNCVNQFQRIRRRDHNVVSASGD